MKAEIKTLMRKVSFLGPL